LPDPDGPTSATTDPGAQAKDTPRSTGASGRAGYVKWTSSKRTSPAHGASASFLDRGAGGASAPGFRSNKTKTLSAAPSASAMFENMSASVLKLSASDCVSSMNATRRPDRSSPLSTRRPP